METAGAGDRVNCPNEARKGGLGHVSGLVGSGNYLNLAAEVREMENISGDIAGFMLEKANHYVRRQSITVSGRKLKMTAGTLKFWKLCVGGGVSF